MKDYKYPITGGGVAGTTAADTIRDEDEDGSIANQFCDVWLDILT